MASISDIIENFILKTLGDDDYVEISRNELAGFFSCAPSQINYVLETRFTVDRGFLIESRRGGGGFIKISKLRLDDDSYITDLVLESVGNELSEKRMVQILERLTREKVISGKESAIALECLSDDAFKNVLVSLLKADGGDEHDV